MKKTLKNIKKTQNKSRKNIYTQEEYNSGEGFLTSIWGSAIWHFLHTISFNYPINPTEGDKKHYRNFILSLQFILPCKYCRQNLVKNFKQLPLTKEDMKNRHAFSMYIYNLHELINNMLGKKSNLTYEEVRERYEHFRARGCNDAKKIKEMGCTTPLYGKKAKCIIKIVPEEKKCETFQMDKKCIKKRIV